MKKNQTKEVLELIRRELQILSELDPSIERSLILLSYRQIIKFWTGEVESEPTSFSLEIKEQVLELYRFCSNLGSESMFNLKKEGKKIV